MFDSVLLLYHNHMMVRFSCFNSQINSQKSKKITQVSAKAMDHASKDYSQIQITGNFESDIVVPNFKTGNLKKSRSLGSELFMQGRGSAEDEIHENDTAQGFSSSDSHVHSKLRVSEDKEDLGENRHQNATSSEHVQTGSRIGNCESIFSIGDAHNLDKEGYENSDCHISGECGNAPANYTSQTAPVIVKSQSLPNISVSPLKRSLLRTKSCEHSLVLCTREKYVYESQIQEKLREKGYSTMGKDENDNIGNYQSGGYNSSGYSGSADNRIVPVMDAESTVRNIQGEFTIHLGDEMPARDFKIKRIEEWVESLQHSAPLEKTNELPFVDEVKRDTDVLKDLTSGKAEAKVTPGMVAAKRYIASLSATSSTAQLANHGLVVIPLLSAFVTLRVLNLSGNSIVRITAGTLPRGLHALNLSKNYISTIDGLRELTRLRILDLSYNKIVRIGHGLAYCSSLKELYLAGNKISEVEGLHRLLKLNVLDLRFNKISTAKCLGQLASNYSSLYAINLEGNPAQKNVGVEQLKKHLQSLLPHLAYYNCNPTKISISADRSARLGTNAHQLDHGLRSDHKSTRKSNHGSGSHKPSSSTHGLKNHIVISPSNRLKGKRVALPPTGASQYHSEFTSKMLNLKPALSMRRSRSEGVLGV